MLDRGWRYDLEVWLFDTFALRGRLRELRRRVLDRAGLDAGSAVLDVGCGTGTLAIEAAARVGAGGRTAGIDPGPKQIARARSKARRRHLAVDFQTAGIEALPFPDASFDAVTSTLMLHHVPDGAKPAGMREIHRVLRPGGRVVVADFTGTAPTGIDGVPALLGEAGFASIETEDVPFPGGAHRGWTGARVVRANKPGA